MHAGVLTFAGLRFGLEDKSFRAGAGVGARCVSAQTVVAKQTVYQALVDVWEEVRAGIGENGTKMQSSMIQFVVPQREGDENVYEIIKSLT